MAQSFRKLGSSVWQQRAASRPFFFYRSPCSHWDGMASHQNKKMTHLRQGLSCLQGCRLKAVVPEGSALWPSNFFSFLNLSASLLLAGLPCTARGLGTNPTLAAQVPHLYPLRTSPHEQGRRWQFLCRQLPGGGSVPHPLHENVVAGALEPSPRLWRCGESFLPSFLRIFSIFLFQGLLWPCRSRRKLLQGLVKLGHGALMSRGLTWEAGGWLCPTALGAHWDGAGFETPMCFALCWCSIRKETANNLERKIFGLLSWFVFLATPWYGFSQKSTTYSC